MNLTQHVATPEQVEAGVFEPSAEDKKMIQKLLTFDEIAETESWHMYQRESIDQVQPDGSVKKTAVFRHCGFVEV